MKSVNRTRLFGGLISLFLISLAAQSAPALDAHYSPITSNGLEITSTQSVGQTFTVERTGRLTRLEATKVKRHRCDSTDPLTIRIFASSNGLPTGSPWASFSVPGSAVPSVSSQPGTVALDLSETPISVLAGTEYAVELNTTSPGGGCTYAWIADVPGAYAGGAAFSNALNPLAAWDMAFAAYVDDLPPLPPEIEIADWNSPDDRLIIRDNSADLEWLRWSATNGRAYNDVSSQLGAGGQFAGWRYASFLEIDELVDKFFSAYASNGTRQVIVGVSAIDADYPRFAEVFGQTGLEESGTSRVSRATYADLKFQGVRYSASIGDRLGAGAIDYITLESTSGDAAAIAGWAHALVRSTTPPLPPNQVPTPAGSNIVVNPTVSLPGEDSAEVRVDVSFDHVQVPGITSVTAEYLTKDGAPPPPLQFRAGKTAIFYDVSTTATFAGNITLCFSWSEGDFKRPNTIKLLHYVNGAWEDVTTSLDLTANIACGQVSSLSPFALFEPTYDFVGFYRPVDNAPVQNTAKAGAAIPIRFSLRGNQGLAILDSGYPASQVMQCDSALASDEIEETVSSGGSSLSYDAGSDQYTYVWKTQKTWANSCRRLVLQLNDGSRYTADFRFAR
jgi:hypothetical protein